MPWQEKMANGLVDECPLADVDDERFRTSFNRDGLLIRKCFGCIDVRVMVSASIPMASHPVDTM